MLASLFRTTGVSSLRTSVQKRLGSSHSFNKLNENDIAVFRRILSSPSSIVQDKDILESMNEDWMKKYKGSSKLALRPRTTEEVSRILKHCNERRLAVVPQGGNTGLVGGSVPVHDEIILSLSLMNKVISFDAVSGILKAQAGCVNGQLDDFLRSHGYVMPLDLGAKGSCHIGGNLATNAGGIRFLRYGSLHGNCLGLEAVLPDGTILSDMSGLRKDNTGYDLKQLFIGSEGTIGVITATALLVPKMSKSVNVMFLRCPTYESVKQTYVKAKNALGEILSAFEYEDRTSLEYVLKHYPDCRDPFPGEVSPFYLLVETSGSNATHDRQKIEEFLTASIEDGCIENGIIAQDETQAKNIWKLRESITSSLFHAGLAYKYDISLPLDDMYKLVQETKKRVEGQPAFVLGYGHIGDCNLHLNVSVPSNDPRILPLIEPFIYEFVGEHGGSISAEHGLGLMKYKYLTLSKKPELISVMRTIKSTFDPNGILNPYKYLP